jgi:hypothetical protein
MFEVIIERLTLGVIGLSMLLFSGYQGNDARFSDTSIHVADYGVYLSTTLADAFTHDFDEIFHSDITLRVYFEARVSSGRRTIMTSDFTHTVRWDSRESAWKVLFCETGTYQLADSMHDLTYILSSVETLLRFDTSRFNTIDISLTARLPVIYLHSIQREFDLMTLWRFRVPRLRVTANLRTDV